MRIVQLSTMDIGGGGGSRAAYRLHCGLRKQGIDAHMVVKFKDTADPTVHGKAIHFSLYRKLHNLPPFIDEIPGWLAHSTAQSKPYYSTAWFPDRLQKRLLQLQPDLVNLHWVNGGFLRLESLAKWPWPLVWTLHDLWPLAGAEHYPDDERYILGYNAYNRPGEESGFDVNRWVWRRKRVAWSAIDRLTIVTPSQWLGNCAKRSALFSKRPVLVIPNGIDVQVFQPKDTNEQRFQLHLPTNKKIVLFVANTIEDKRKGFDLLLEALTVLRQQPIAENIVLAVVGASRTKKLDDIGWPVYYLGYIDSEEKLTTIYNAADILVVPSRQDNLPNTILEAMSCGTPCVAFNVGGLPDMIIHQQTGYLAAPEDSPALARGIEWALEDETRLKMMRDLSRQRIERHFSDTLQAKRYSDLYQNTVQAFH